MLLSSAAIPRQGIKIEVSYFSISMKCALPCRAMPDIVKISATLLRSALLRHTLPVTFMGLSLKLFAGLWCEYSGHNDVTLSLFGRVLRVNSSAKELFVETVAREGTYINLQLKILTNFLLRAYHISS